MEHHCVYRVPCWGPTLIEGANIGTLGSAPGDRSTTQGNLPPLRECFAFFVVFVGAKILYFTSFDEKGKIGVPALYRLAGSDMPWNTARQDDAI